jgi:DNA-binding CsgD family transcriptional regulator/tetratricopeptide (TPR) repeat protein
MVQADSVGETLAIVDRTELDEMLIAIGKGRHVRLSGTWGSGKTTLLRGLVGSSASLELVSGASASVNSLEAHLKQRNAEAILVVDDAHLLSDEAAQILALRLRPDGPVTVLSHCASSDLPLALQRAWKDGGGTSIVFRRLDRLECSSFVSSLGSKHLDRTALDRLHHHSGGIVRLLVALARAAIGEPVFESLDVLVHINALRSELPTSERSGFDTLAIAGPVPIDVAEQLVDAEVLSRLELRGLLVTDSPERISLAAQIFEVHTDRFTALALRRQVFRSLLTLLQKREKTRSLSLAEQMAVARWACAVDGDLSLVRRGLRASLLLPNFEKAIAFGEHVLLRDPADLESAHRLATAFEATGNHDAAFDVARTLRGLNEPLWQQRVLYNQYMATRSQGALFFEEGGSASSPKTSFPRTGSADGQETTAHLSWFHLFAGDLQQARDVAEFVIGCDDSTTQAVVWAATIHAIASVLLGYGEESLAALDFATRRIAERVSERSENNGGPGDRRSDGGDDGGSTTRADESGKEEVNLFADLQLGAARLMVLLRSGDLGGAIEIGTEGLRDVAHPLLGAAWHGFIGLAKRERGDFDQAASHLRECVEALSGDPYGLGTVAQSELMVCEAMQIPQNGSGAKHQLAKTSAGVYQTGVSETASEPEPVGLFRSVVMRNQAWSVAAAGGPTETAEACEILTNALAWSSEREQTTYELLLLVDLARFGRARFAMERFAGFVRVENPLLRTGSLIVRALSERNVAVLHQATTAARTSSWGVAKDELALLTSRGLQAAGQSHEAARLEVAWNPQFWPTPICRSEELRLVLTPRERECAMFAVAGKSSASIAQQRSLSTRTVDNLLSHAYQKCGVASRRELAEATQSAAAG